MIPVPRKKLLKLLLIPLLFLIAGNFSFFFLIIGISLDLIILILGFYDLFTTRGDKKLKIKVHWPPFFYIARQNPVTIDLFNHGPGELELMVKLEIPPFFIDKTEHKSFILQEGEHRKFKILFHPERRGVYKIKYLYYRYNSGLGLFTVNHKLKIEKQVEVFPDVKELSRYLMMARKHRLADIGFHKSRNRGIGIELESLREYYPGEAASNIDWKVTTRVNRPVTRVFRMETSNTITLVLDCGRLMTAEQHGMNTLDHAVNSILTLSNIIFRQGDHLNLIAFSDKIIGELPPTKGKAALSRVTRFLTALEPQFVESNYTLIFELLQRRLKKRSLVIFFSDIIDDINYDLFKKYLTILNKKHQTLFILLRDTTLEHLTEQSSGEGEGLFTAAAAREMFLRRQETITKLKKSKIHILDTLPSRLTPGLVDKYLDIKNRGI